MSKLLIILFIVLTGIFLIRYTITKQAVFGDALYYWSYTRSLYFDHNIDLQNELTHTYHPKTNNNTTEPVGNNVVISKKQAHHLPVGAGLIWLLPFTLGDGLVAVANTFHIPLTRNGYSDTYQLTTGVTNILLVVLGLSFMLKILRKEYSKKVALIAIAAIIFSTNLFFYTSIDPINSHPPSFFLSSLFLYFWYITRSKRTFFHWIIMGIIAGFLACVRTQDITVLALPFFEIVLLLLRKQMRMLSAGKSLLYYLLGFILGFLPQLVIWYVTFGSIISPYLDTPNAFSFTHPHLLDIILNPKIGILYYSPIILIGVVGLYMRRKKENLTSTVMLLGFFLQYTIIASYNGWHQGEAYGVRMLISTYPLLLFGLCEALDYLSKKISFYPLLIVCLLSILNNIQAILFFVLLVHDRI